MTKKTEKKEKKMANHFASYVCTCIFIYDNGEL